VQWLQDRNQSSLDNLNDARREACRYFRNKKMEYLKAKINELEAKSKNKNIREMHRGINDFKKGYQLRTNIVKIQKGNLVAEFDSILTRRSNHFFELLNIHGISDVRQTEIRTVELLVLQPITF
jgi:hypothetical protein